MHQAPLEDETWMQCYGASILDARLDSRLSLATTTTLLYSRKEKKRKQSDIEKCNEKQYDRKK